ncbi:predicted protein [Chaetoceros tenuissimus]|uniref:G-protein coupled receptors family 1 profile domain-containing protein n=1 Tax=Chaetoceros tenuissimus TaxID=426638 RepID=A0AAD3D2L0_9STRA|nr:predicted protein [Chaetoceros tenuissimus]
MSIPEPKAGYMWIPYSTDMTLWQTIASSQITTSSMSIIASLAIITSIIKTNSLKTPYARLIFSLSIADVLHSVPFMLGPFIPPKTFHPAEWAIGNYTSCRVFGIMGQIGAILSILHYTLLSFYYVCKIAHKLSDQQFEVRYERKLRLLIYVFLVVYVPISLSITWGGPDRNGFYCTMTNVMKADCNEDLGACQWDVRRIKSATRLALFYGCLVCAVFLTTLFCMGLIIYHAIMRDRVYRQLQPSNLTTRNTNSNTQVSNERTSQASSVTAHSIMAKNLRILYLRQTFLQGFLFCFSFIFCYIPFLIYILIIFRDNTATVSQAHLFAISTFQPLSGILNILIYTRPAIVHLRRLFPDYTWIKAFVTVLKSGGEVPHGLRSSALQNNTGENNPSVVIQSIPYGVINPSMENSSNLNSVNAENLGSMFSRTEGDECYRSQQKWSYVRESGAAMLFSINEADFFSYASEEKFDDDHLSYDDVIDEDTGDTTNVSRASQGNGNGNH